MDLVGNKWVKGSVHILPGGFSSNTYLIHRKRFPFPKEEGMRYYILLRMKRTVCTLAFCPHQLRAVPLTQKGNYEMLRFAKDETYGLLQ